MAELFPSIQFDADSDIPLYRQLYAAVKSAIESGGLHQGDRIPPTRQLAGQLGLNRATVSAAYELLESDGYIRGHVGRGSFVLAPSATVAPDWSAVLPEPDSGTPPAAPPGSISFATARPSEDLFPISDFRACCDEVLSGADAAVVLQLGSPYGYGPLRAYLLEEARRTGIARPGDDLLITNGCQQGLDLVRRVLVRLGDAVVIEDPVYPGLRNLFANAGARLVGVPVGPEGLRLHALAGALRTPGAKVLVTTPSFQNPTGATLPSGARAELLRLAREHGVVVVENDSYGDLRYAGATLAPLKQLDDTGGVVLLRSFSKLAFPGLRVGWIIAPQPLIARLAEAKQLADLHTDQLSQAALLRFAESGRLAAHRDRVVAAGRERLHVILAACERSLPVGTEFTRPEGGMNLWVRLPRPLDAGDLLPRAHREGIAYLPGRWFEVTHRESGALRLCFAGLTPEKIRAGLGILGRICSAELASATREPRVPATAVV